MDHAVPGRQTHGLDALLREIGDCQVDPGQRLADAVSLAFAGVIDRNTGQEFYQRHCFPRPFGLAGIGYEAECGSIAVMNRGGNGRAFGRQMIEQAKVERQIFRVHALLVHGEDEARALAILAGCFDQPIAVGNALGDAFGRHQLPDIILGNQFAELLSA